MISSVAINLSFMLGKGNMKMGWRMVVHEHLYFDSVEDSKKWHASYPFR